MPKQQREKTNYPGVYYIEGTSADGNSEKIFYIHYRKDGKLIEEKAGRQFKDDMTPAKATKIRTQRSRGTGRPIRNAGKCQAVSGSLDNESDCGKNT